ncbi:MAG: flagellar protein FlaG [Anaerovibrio sp.]|nr:flagellar protein FlaG [Anaerovibrio sp.]
MSPSKIKSANEAAQSDNKKKEEDNESKHQALDSINEEFVSEMTKELNELMSKLNCDLEFKYHKEVNVMSVKMIDKKTDEVIKEYPPEEMVEGMIRAQEWLGAFLDRNA